MRRELSVRIEALEKQLQVAQERYRELSQQAQHTTLDIQRLAGGLMALRELAHALEHEDAQAGDDSATRGAGRGRDVEVQAS